MLVGLSGLEPPTSRLSGARSNLLSYKPILGAIQIPSVACGCFPLVEMMGFEPMTPCLQGRCSPNWATPPLVCLFFDFAMNIEAENAKHSSGWSFTIIDNPSKLNNKRRVLWISSSLVKILLWVMQNSIEFCRFSIERRWSSRTFRYGYLVTT